MLHIYWLHTLLAMLAGLGFYIYKNWSNALLSKVPGPISARLTPLYRVYLLWSGECPQKFKRLHEEFGSVVRTGPNHIVTSDPGAIFTIYDAGWGFPKVRDPCLLE